MLFKRLFIYCITLCFLSSPSIAQSNTEGDNFVNIDERLSLSVGSDGLAVIRNTYLTNYILRGRDPSTGEVGSFIILNRNEQALDLSTVLNFEGLLPNNESGFEWPLQIPEFAENITELNLDAYSFPNKVTWENSDLVFRGANLGDLIFNFPETPDESLDALLLFLLNTITAVEIGTEVAGATDAVFSIGNLDKLRPLAEKIQNFQDYLAQASDVLVICEEYLAIANELLDGVDNDFEHIERVQGGLEYAQSFIDAVNALNISIPVDDTRRIARRGTIRKQFELLVETSVEDTFEIAKDKFKQRFQESFEGASSDEEKLIIVEEYVLELFHNTFSSYEQELKDQIAELDEATSQEDINNLQTTLVLSNDAFSIAGIAELIFETDDFEKIVLQEPDIILSTLFDIATTAAQQLITIDNVEIVSKEVLQQAKGWDGRSSPFEVIRSTADNTRSILNRLKLGSTIGNKMIPFIWDITLSPNYIESSITNGKVSILGPATSTVTITEADGSERIFDNIISDEIVFYAADEGDIISVNLNLFQPNIFDAERVPWERSMLTFPTQVFNASVQFDGVWADRRLCVKSAFNVVTLASHFTNDRANFVGARGCDEGTDYFWLEAFTAQSGQALYSDFRELPTDFRIDVLLEERSDILFGNYRVKGTSNEAIITDVSLFDFGQILKTIKIIPKSGNVDFSFNLDGATTDNPFVNVQVGEEFLNSPDPISVITWIWGDGSINTASLANGEDVSTLFSRMHNYAEAGVYEIILGITRESGQVSERRITVNVLAPNLPAPTSLSVKAGDQSVAVTWEVVNSVGSYNLYYAEESFGNPPNIENYASFEGGKVIQNISTNEYIVSRLANEKPYYFVVTAVNNYGEGEPSMEASAIPKELTYRFSSQMLARLETDLYVIENTTLGGKIIKYSNDISKNQVVLEFSSEFPAANILTMNNKLLLVLDSQETRKIYLSNNGVNWEEGPQINIQNCDSISCSLVEVLIEEDTIVLRYSTNLGDTQLFHWVNEGVSNRGSSSTAKSHSLINNTIYSIDPFVRAGSSGALVLREVTPISSTSQTVGRGRSASGSVALQATFSQAGKYQYMWTSRGFTERDREYHFGIDRDGLVVDQTCTGLEADLRSIRSQEALSLDNLYFEHAYETLDNGNSKYAIFKWVDNDSCHLVLSSTFELNQNYLVRDRVSIGNDLFLYISQRVPDGPNTPKLVAIPLQ